MAIDADGRFDAEPLACHACRAKAQALRQFTNGDHADVDGVYFVVVDREVNRHA